MKNEVFVETNKTNKKISSLVEQLLQENELSEKEVIKVMIEVNKMLLDQISILFDKIELLEEKLQNKELIIKGKRTSC